MEQKLGFHKLGFALFLTLTLSNPVALPQQYADVTAHKAFGVTQPEEEIRALSLTRFHFSTLKAFHNTLLGDSSEEANVPSEEARIMNAAIDAFLKNPGREEIMLRALREQKLIRLKFTVRLPAGRYEMVPHPRKELLYRFESVSERVLMSLDIRPLLDSPLAFEITLKGKGEHHLYDVDWAGDITSSFLSNGEMLW